MYPAPPIQRPAGEAGVTSCLPGRDPGRVVAPGILEPGITWYDVLGALPGAEARKIKQKYDAKAALLQPELISGAPPNVLTAVMRAQELLDTAWQVLGDPQSRKRYDGAVGFRRSGGGLGEPGTGIGLAGTAPAELGITGDLGGDAVAELLALTGWPGPRRRRNRRGAVLDVRGLFFPVGLEVATRRGLHVRIVQLTEHAMAVDGLVVDQDPRPPTKAHRGDRLTVQVWHPPAGSR
jgi:DnaJ domain